MTFSYTANPWASPDVPIDDVRFLIGDTTTPGLLQDGEILGLLANNANDPYGAAVEACTSLMAHFAREVDKTVGNASISASQRFKAYALLRTQIQAASTRHGGAPVPYAGGISIADMQSDLEDDDHVPSQFTVGMMDSHDSGESGQSNSFTEVTPE